MKTRRNLALLAMLLAAVSTLFAALAASAAKTPKPPVSKELPAISGRAVKGSVLQATTGIWKRKPTSYTYHWRDCNATGGACTAISGANSTSYTLATKDVGHRIVVAVAASQRRRLGRRPSPPPTGRGHGRVIRHRAAAAAPARAAAAARARGCSVVLSSLSGVDAVCWSSGAVVCLAGGSYGAVVSISVSRRRRMRR